MLIRRTLIFLCAVLCASVLSAQVGTIFTVDGIKYCVTKDVNGYEVEVSWGQGTISGAVTIPETVTNNNITYTVTAIGESAFFNKTGLTSITLPNTIVTIKSSAFEGCTGLTSIVIPNSVTTIKANAFKNCGNLKEVVVGSGVTSIESGAFGGCAALNKITSLATTAPTLGINVFWGVTKPNVNLVVPTGSDYSSWGFGNVQGGAGSGDNGGSGDNEGGGNEEGGNEEGGNDGVVRFTIDNLTYEVIEQNTVKVYKCNTSATSVTVPTTVSHNNTTYSVTAIGDYAFNNCNNLTSITCLSTTEPTLASNAFGMSPTNKQLTIPFNSNYSSWESATTWSKINHKINAGETKTLNATFYITSDNKRAIINEGVLVIEQGGEIVNTTTTNVGGIIEIVSQSANEGNWNFFGAPFADYKLEVIKPHPTSDVAVCKYDYSEGAWADDAWATPDTSMNKGEGAFAYHFYTGTMTFTTQGENTTYSLNNGDVSVTHNLVNSSNGYWMALSNPYPAKLSISKFLSAQTRNTIQGSSVYVWNGTSFALKSSGDINVSQGFFVNYRRQSRNNATAKFQKTQLTNYPTNAKSEIAPREFIELALVNGEESVKVYFAQNEEAEQEYDIYDANKMFATMGAAEPYLLTDGIALIKEEVKTLPYYATMNVRSEDNAEMNFVLNNLPDGYAVSIIDGDNVIDMAEGSVYSTQIASGDNENRFKLLVKQAVGLAEVEELDVRITNSDRHIAVQTAEKNIAIEVYNTLGQKVFTSKEHNFILKGVSAGVYMIKAFNQSGSKTAKIVVK